MFTADGELKPEYRDLESAESAPPEEPAGEPAIEPPKNEPAAASPPPDAPPGGAEADFVDLVRSLATSAYAALGLLPEPGAPVSRDLPGAQRLIDWLSLLERKTRNNLSFAEQDLLTRALYELRMAYVEASGAPAAPPLR